VISITLFQLIVSRVCQSRVLWWFTVDLLIYMAERDRMGTSYRAHHLAFMCGNLFVYIDDVTDNWSLLAKLLRYPHNTTWIKYELSSSKTNTDMTWTLTPVINNLENDIIQCNHMCWCRINVQD